MLQQIKESVVQMIAPEIIERRNQMERLANTDELTNLPNRRAFELSHGKARRDGLAFILFDLNHFGRVNKLCGHETGDAVLKYYADVIANVAHNFKARAFRFGGDEFVIIAPPRFAYRIRESVENRALAKTFGDFTVSISGEIGMTLAAADSKIQNRKRERKTA